MKKIWNEPNYDNDLLKREKEISQKFNISNLVSRIIAKKNLSDEQIKIFLEPTRNDFYDPYLMPDMEKAIDRIQKAIENNEKITIYGDYDVDGITSVSILNKFFKEINVETNIYIPNRLSEGYGLNDNAIKTIANNKTNLIITVDCGITSIHEVETAKELGMDVIITDHHEPGEELPKAIAVIDCKRSDNTYPFRELAGCGVAFKLTQGLSKKFNLNENIALKNLDLASIGTISDIVPLVDENRTIAKLGLLLVNQTKKVGLRELINQTNYKSVNSETVSFGLSPRINASGRMGHQEDALELFLTEDPIKARNLAKKLEEYNKERQTIEKRIFDEAVEKAEGEKDKQCIVLGSNEWHHGIIGIVSSKITDKYYKPSLLICFEGEDSKGSGRSIKGFDLHEAVENCKDDLTAFGGHSMAVGVSLKTKDFEKFKSDFEKYASKKITNDMLSRTIDIDEVITKNDINLLSIKDLKKLEPYGEGNQKPVILYKNLKIDSIRTLTEGKHLKLLVEDDGTYINAMGFGLGNLAEEYKIGDKIDIVGNIEVNSYNGFQKVQLIITDIRKSV